MSVPSAEWQERYGRRPPMPARRRVLLGLAGVAVLVALTTGMAWWIWSSGPQLDWSVVGYEVRSDSEVAVDFAVAKPDGTAVTCRVVAKDRSMAVVGSTDVDLPAAGGDVRRTAVVSTRGRAVVGTVDSCVARSG